MSTKRDEQKAFKKLCEKTEGYSTFELHMQRGLSGKPQMYYKCYNAVPLGTYSDECATPMEAVNNLLQKKGATK